MVRGTLGGLAEPLTHEERWRPRGLVGTGSSVFAVLPGASQEEA